MANLPAGFKIYFFKAFRQNKSLILDGFIQEIETRPPVIEEFDRKLWSVTVDKRLRFTEMRPAIDGKEGQPYHE